MITEYIRSSSAEEALFELQKGQNKAAFLAGGTEIQRLGSSVKVTKVVSLKDLKLNEIVKKDDVVRIGSTVTFQQALDSLDVPQYLKEALLFMNSRPKRNVATIGGNIALSRDDSYLMSTLIAAKARLVLANITQEGSYSEEDIPIREYHSFKEHFDGSLILAIVLNKPGRFVASERFAITAQSMASVTLSFGADISSKEVRDVRIAAAIKGSGVVRLTEIEKELSGSGFAKAEDIAIHVGDDIAFVDDVTGKGSYKKYILATAVADLYNRCLKAIEKGGIA